MKNNTRSYFIFTADGMTMSIAPGEELPIKYQLADILIALEEHNNNFRGLWGDPPKCECGKEKSGALRHLDWCPKAHENTTK